MSAHMGSMTTYATHDIVRYWPGTRPGRTAVATVISDGVVPFGGTDCLRIKQEDGGTDYIAITHVEKLGRIDGRTAHVQTGREAMEVCDLDIDSVVVEDRADSLKLAKLARAFR